MSSRKTPIKKWFSLCFIYWLPPPHTTISISLLRTDTREPIFVYSAFDAFLLSLDKSYFLFYFSYISDAHIFLIYWKNVHFFKLWESALLNNHVSSYYLRKANYFIVSSSFLFSRHIYIQQYIILGSFNCKFTILSFWLKQFWESF